MTTKKRQKIKKNYKRTKMFEKRDVIIKRSFFRTCKEKKAKK